MVMLIITMIDDDDDDDDDDADADDAAAADDDYIFLAPIFLNGHDDYWCYRLRFLVVVVFK